MANQPELDQYDAGVYQLEKTDPVLGGLGGASNAPLVNLANRTKYLYNRIQEMLGIAKIYSLAGGTANAITGAYTPAVTTVADGQVLRFKGGFANTGATTFTPNSGGSGAITAAPIYGRDHQPLTGGEIVVNGACSVQWNAALNSGNGAWVLVENTGGAQRSVAGVSQAHLATVAQIQSAGYAADTGAVNAYAVALTPAVGAYFDGMKVRFLVAHTSTGACTLAVNGLAATAIVGGAHAALVSGELFAGGYAEAEYNAGLAKFVLLECTGAPMQIAPATQGQHALQKQQKGFVVFTSNGSTVVPAGVTQMLLRGCAGGAGGGASASGTSATGSGGGGGGAGQPAVDLLVTVVPLETITVVVGAGGLPGTGAQVNGSNGGNTTITGSVSGLLLSLTGGTGGSHGVNTAGASAGGGGGNGFPNGASGSDTNSGSSGPAGNGGTGGGGPFGGPGAGGRGGNTAGIGATPAYGYGVGGGGGGGYYTAGTGTFAPGSAGMPGFVSLQL